MTSFHSTCGVVHIRFCFYVLYCKAYSLGMIYVVLKIEACEVMQVSK